MDEGGSLSDTFCRPSLHHHVITLLIIGYIIQDRYMGYNIQSYIKSYYWLMFLHQEGHCEKRCEIQGGSQKKAVMVR